MPNDITHHRDPAILLMTATFPGVDLPDAGFLAAMFAPDADACPRD
jgi:hypothetical protein